MTPTTGLVGESARQAYEETTRLRGRIGGACLVLAPLAFAAAELLAPEGTGSATQILRAWAGHRTEGLVAVFAGLLSVMLFVPGIFAMLTPVADRGRRLGHVALAAIVYGLVTAHAALGGLNLMFYLMTDPSLNDSQMAPLGNVLMSNAAAGAPLLLGHYVFSIGIVLLGIATIRSRVYHSWPGVALIVALVADMVLGSLPLPDHIDDILSNVAFVAGFAAIGWQLLTGRRADTP